MIYKVQNFVQFRLREAWKSKGQEAASGECLSESQNSVKPPGSADSHRERDVSKGQARQICNRSTLKVTK